LHRAFSIPGIPHLLLDTKCIKEFQTLDEALKALYVLSSALLLHLSSAATHVTLSTLTYLLLEL
jgi:hypothetical protein